jgi:hypothetical protein
MKTLTKRKTSAQKKAYDHYKLMQQMEDNYLRSVFANERGAKQQSDKVEKAYRDCLALGLTYENGWDI